MRVNPSLLINLSALVICVDAGALLAQSVPAAPAQGAPTGQPVKDAPALSVEEQARFNKAADYSKGLDGHGVLIQRGGEVIFERFDNGWKAEMPHPLASGTKSFTGVAAMFAVQDGLLTLDELASDTLTEWKSDPRKSKVTIRHLLTLSSGIDPGENGGLSVRQGRMPARADDSYADAIAAKGMREPGAAFNYGPNHFYAFAALLERKLAKSDIKQKNAWDYYTARIFEPIGLKVGRIGRDKAGRPNLPGGCMLTAREWAKFGQLVLQNGSWKQADGSMKNLLKPDLLEQCFVPSAANPSYGLTWWLRNSGEEGDTGGATPRGESLRERLQRRNLDEQNKPIVGPDGKPIRVIMAAGLGKQRLYVLPQYDMVIVRFGELRSDAKGWDDRVFLGHILGLERGAEPAKK